MEERIQIWLSRAGFGSRRACEQLIRDGRVTLDGETAILGARTANPDSILVDVQPIRISKKSKHFLLYKPTGYVSTMQDPEGRPCVAELLPQVEGRLFPVGRLDFGSEGLMLITSDGQLAEALMHPRGEIEKEYVAKLKNQLDEKQTERLLAGVVESGERLRLESITPLPSRSLHAWYSIVLKEGKNRHIRRMMMTIGEWVIKLKRVRIGSILIGDLQPGEIRPLEEQELQSLKSLVEKTPLAPARRRRPFSGSGRPRPATARDSSRPSYSKPASGESETRPVRSDGPRPEKRLRADFGGPRAERKPRPDFGGPRAERKPRPDFGGPRAERKPRPDFGGSRRPSFGNAEPSKPFARGLGRPPRPEGRPVDQSPQGARNARRTRERQEDRMDYGFRDRSEGRGERRPREGFGRPSEGRGERRPREGFGRPSEGRGERRPRREGFGRPSEGRGERRPREGFGRPSEGRGERRPREGFGGARSAVPKSQFRPGRTERNPKEAFGRQRPAGGDGKFGRKAAPPRREQSSELRPEGKKSKPNREDWSFEDRQ